MTSSIDKHEPLPLEGTGVEVAPVLRDLVEQRIRGGEAKYGMKLRTHNGRDSLMDALQEQIDGLQYVTQAYLERETLRAQLAIAEKVIEAMRRLVEAMGDLSTARLTEGIPLELANQIGVHHLEAYAALAEYDKLKG